jgi:endogenous inhibitor of DNA gyrase (YacG/DUF329 family)
VSTASGGSAPCPRCGKPASLASTNPWRPFCGERCKLIDLGKWASEQFSIPAEDQSPEPGDDGSISPPRKH